MGQYCPSCGCWDLMDCTALKDPQRVYVCAQCDQIWTEKGLEAALSSMKLENKKEVNIAFYRIFPIPGYVNFGHRHLEKEQPAPRDVSGTEARYIIPVDLLSIPLPADLVGEIESVELVYKRGG